MKNLGENEIADRLSRKRNPLFGLLKQCQIVGGNYQEIFGEMVFHPVHPLMYSKRWQLIILRLFEGDIQNFPISTIGRVGDKISRNVKIIEGQELHWGASNQLSDLDMAFFGSVQHEVLLPGDVAIRFGLETLQEIKPNLL